MGPAAPGPSISAWCSIATARGAFGLLLVVVSDGRVAAFDCESAAGFAAAEATPSSEGADDCAGGDGAEHPTDQPALASRIEAAEWVSFELLATSLGVDAMPGSSASSPGRRSASSREMLLRAKANQSVNRRVIAGSVPLDQYRQPCLGVLRLHSILGSNRYDGDESCWLQLGPDRESVPREHFC